VAFGLAPIGALAALLFPESDAAKYPRIKFRSIEFYFNHTMLIITPTYMCRFLGYVPGLYSFFWFTVTIAAMFSIAAMANRDTGGNYMYISHAPNSGPMMYLERRVGPRGYKVAIVAAVSAFYLIMHALAVCAYWFAR